MQLPLLPFGEQGVSRSSAAAAAARLLGESPERVGVDATEFLTVRKVGTAVVFSLVAAFAVGFWRRETGGWLLAAIPRLSASTVGVVRIALAAGLVWALMYTGPVEPGFPLALQRDAGPLANWPWLHALAAHDRATIWIHGALIGAVAVFGAGLFSRVSIVAVAALTLLQTLVLLQRQSTHDWGLPLATLFLLTIVPWGDGLSVDAAWRRSRTSGARACRDGVRSGRLDSRVCDGRGLPGRRLREARLQRTCLDHRGRRAVPLRDRCGPGQSGLGSRRGGELMARSAGLVRSRGDRGAVHSEYPGEGLGDAIAVWHRRGRASCWLPVVPGCFLADVVGLAACLSAVGPGGARDRQRPAAGCRRLWTPFFNS